jgi:phenylpyruvate tautomerase PptA (4-oxalocrotonate tautomerase family)
MPVITVKARAGHSPKTIDTLTARLRKITARTLKSPIESVWVLYEEVPAGCAIYGDFDKIPWADRRKAKKKK